MNQINIKFRGKRKDTGEWIEGGYYFDGIETYIKPYRKNVRFGSGFEVIPETVGQFIGKLTNGDEIFINDLIKHGQTVRVVEYRDGNTFLRRQSGRETILLSFSPNPIKLGNIFDNPELLEVPIENLIENSPA